LDGFLVIYFLLVSGLSVIRQIRQRRWRLPDHNRSGSHWRRPAYEPFRINQRRPKRTELWPVYSARSAGAIIKPVLARGSTQPNALRGQGWPIISNLGLPPAVFFDGNGFYV
jgi:hypothetical protein